MKLIIIGISNITINTIVYAFPYFLDMESAYLFIPTSEHTMLYILQVAYFIPVIFGYHFPNNNFVIYFNNV